MKSLAIAILIVALAAFSVYADAKGHGGGHGGGHSGHGHK